MASCEKCWSDSSGRDGSGANVERYHELLKERDCTPEEQAGPEADTCPTCQRRTVHQYAHVCMVGCALPSTADDKESASGQ